MLDNANHDHSAIDDGDVVFTEASPHQRLLSWQLNGASWAAPMSLDDYIARERALSEAPLSRNGGTKYYVLCLKNDPETIVSACEVTAKRAVVVDDSGRCRLVDAYGLASVYTAPRFRRRGMAGHLLREVQGAVDAEPNHKEFGALYSDIGREYYTKLGWRDWRSPQVKITLQEGFHPPPAAVAKGAAVFLADDQISSLCEKDTTALMEKFERLARDRKDNKTHVAFLPSHLQVSWHFTRETCNAKILTGREIQHRGAQTADGRSWVYWDHDLREKKLKVLRVVTSAEDELDKRVTDIKELLKMALVEAHDWGLPALAVWSPDEAVSGAATAVWLEAGEHLQVTMEERQDGSIPSLRWSGGLDTQHVVWENCEYYAWC